MNDASVSDELALVLRVPSTVYRCSALKNTAYKFTGRCFVSIESSDPAYYVVTIRAKTPESWNADDVAGAFWNELLDQDLRETIAEETNGIRDLILAQAFSQVSIFHPEFDRQLTDCQRVPGSDEPQ